MKDKFHVMNLQRFAKISVLTLTLFLSTFTFQSARADISIDFDSTTTGSDESQGNVTANDCAQLETSLAASLGCDQSSEVSDFTTYTGKLEAPDASGYDSALTQATDARSLVQKIVNFALSFLGLIAIVIVIYGGFLYVTSRGDDTQATEGKKAITYAAIGILIILGSYAGVNTLLGATGADTGTRTTTDQTISEAGDAFDLRSVLEEVNNIASEYVNAYQTYLKVTQEVSYLKSIEMPLIVDVTEKDYTVGGFIDWLGGEISGTDTDFADQYSLINKNDVSDYSEKLRTGLRTIQSNVDSLSDVYETSQGLYNYLRSGTTSYRQKSLLEQIIPRANAYAGTTGCSGREYSNTYSDIGLGITYNDTTVSALDDSICSYLDAITEAASADYFNSVSDLVNRLDTLAKLFDVSGTSGSTLKTLTSRIDMVQQEFDNADDISKVSASSVSTIVENLNKIYQTVKNVQFVRAVINTSATDGNAPLIVRFDTLGSIDPSNKTITDEQITWDLNGDGNFNDAMGAATNYEYDSAGTYRAAVRITSSKDDIAAGIAYATVEVSPRSSVIKLTATAGGESTALADYSLFPAIDKETYKVTLNEAKSGLTFDASNSTDGAGEPLIFYSWEFGDGEITEGSQEGTVTHAYGKNGTYTLALTVTDSTGIRDRKYVKLYVGSPAARISVSPDSGKIGTKFRFSGAGSTTDIGTIISYQWGATLGGSAYSLASDNGVQIDDEFNEPGIYAVSLTVTDSSGGNDTDTVEVLVESQNPVAKFTYSVPDYTQPGTWVFDASSSYDPDPTDTLTYAWDFEGTEGTDWEKISEDSGGKKVTLKFLTIGERTVTLTVADNHEGELQKTAAATAIIDVSSVLDIGLDTGTATYKLDSSGTAEAGFSAISNTGSKIEIDFGDGETGFAGSLSAGKATFQHSYKQGGVFNVIATALDDNNLTNSVTRRIYIGSGDSPLAVINVKSDGSDIGFGDTLNGSVKTVFTFDGSSSINLDGTGNNLSYSWNFGDGTTSTQKNVTHSYGEKGEFTTTLIVKDSGDPTLTNTSTIGLKIEGIPPKITGLSIAPSSATLVTPLKVDVKVDATDTDGKISYIKAWYYDINDSARELGTLTSQSTSFTITVNTKGEEDQVVTYGFAVEVTDNDNNVVASGDQLEESGIPTLTVTNGPNKTPSASFSVDRTSVKLGDEINFTSTAKDTDGTIISYIWDVEGDGFFNNEVQTSPAFSYSYKEIHKEGIPVSLKVEDNSGATAVSDSITVFVDSNTAPPRAAFLTDISGTSVKFTDNSDIDTEHGAAHAGVYWDFNTKVDSDGDGEPDNDVEALNESNPSYTYDALGIYSVKMTEVDSTGQSDSVTADVNVMTTLAPKASFTYTVADKSVTFRNNSTADTSGNVDIRSYQWDFDTAVDSDGDGKSDNDKDADTKSMTYDYPEYGAYNVKLTVTDTTGKEDDATNSVEVASPIAPLAANFTSVPAPDSSGKIVLTGTSGYVTFHFNATGGSGDYSFLIDKNIFYDTNGDGVRTNDADNTTAASGSWKTNFDKSYGQIVAKLTVTDNKTGDSAIATLQVTFQGSLGGANLFNATNSELLLFIFSALIAALAGTALVYRNKPKH